MYNIKTIFMLLYRNYFNKKSFFRFFKHVRFINTVIYEVSSSMDETFKKNSTRIFESWDQMIFF